MSKEDLSWIETFQHRVAIDLLWSALEECGAIVGNPPVLRAGPLAGMFAALMESVALPVSKSTNTATLVWTIPGPQPQFGVKGKGYLAEVQRIVSGCSKSLHIVSPFIDADGVGLLLEPLLNAMSRGVELTWLTHDVCKGSSINSKAIEGVRREAERLGARMSVYSAPTTTANDRTEHPLIHAKLFVADASTVLLGSANCTSYAFTANVEAGVVLNGSAAEQCVAAIDWLIGNETVYLVFATGSS